MPSKMRRSSDHGGIFGLSIANVIQLAAMNTKMIKSNQFFSTKVLHWSRNLKSYEKKTCMKFILRYFSFLKIIKKHTTYLISMQKNK